MGKYSVAKLRRKKKRANSSGLNLFYVGLGLFAFGLVMLIVGYAVPKGWGRAGVMLFAFMNMGTGCYIAVGQIKAKRLVFGDDALRAHRCMTGKLIGQIPYDNIATVKIDDLVTRQQVMTYMPVGGVSVAVPRESEQREQVVGIAIFDHRDPDTYWPCKAQAKSNDFDFYINKHFGVSFSQAEEEINERALDARERKLREMHQRKRKLD